MLYIMCKHSMFVPNALIGPIHESSKAVKTRGKDSWHMPTTPYSTQYGGCNNVYTVFLINLMLF